MRLTTNASHLLRPAAIAIALVLCAVLTSAVAQEPRDAAACVTWRAQLNREGAAMTLAEAQAFLRRVPASCPQTRALAQARINALTRSAQGAPAPVAPPQRQATPPRAQAPAWSPPVIGADPRAGQEFNDCSGAAWCPRMAIIPAGSFTIGSPASEADRDSDEGPPKRISIRRFAVSKYEITFAQWDACVEGGGCDGYRPEDYGWGRGNRPVVGMSWNDAQTYVRWLAERTGKPYRLLTEAEWEYAARAGTATPWSWGSDPNGACRYANSYDETAMNAPEARTTSLYARCSDGFAHQTAPVGSFAPNRFGLYDMHGNAWEWVQDCYTENSYSEVEFPTNGAAYEWIRCGWRSYRGGSWYDFRDWLRSASRRRAGPEDRGYGPISNHGFRVARALD